MNKGCKKSKWQGVNRLNEFQIHLDSQCLNYRCSLTFKPQLNYLKLNHLYVHLNNLSVEHIIRYLHQTVHGYLISQTSAKLYNKVVIKIDLGMQMYWDLLLVLQQVYSQWVYVIQLTSYHRPWKHLILISQLL